jgi:hypothetical protein
VSSPVLRVSGQNEKIIAGVGFQHDDSLSAGRRAIISMPHTSANFAAGVEMQGQVGAAKPAFFPARNFVLFRAQSLGHGFFRYFAVAPSGSSGNVSLSVQSLAKFLVCTAYVFVERVSAPRFIARQVIA